ncbi:MAG: GNAT family N-acetyltransferase [Candidatus Gracilibacteria bacterium]|nr:GNAT family N-acetyltransferase [Candidatus Gracilibacteria bacterium]
MNIREANINDLEKCEELSQMPELIWASGEYYTKDFLERYLENNEGCFLVVELENIVIGYLLGEKLKAKGSIVWSMGIQKEYRGKGIGSKLLKTFEKNIQDDGYEWTYLVGRTESEELKHFYSKNGFSVGKNNTEYEKFF